MQARLSNTTDFAIRALCFVFALALQIQVTFFHSETYLGLRINLADILTPAAGLFILITLLRGASQWPQWRMKYVYAWLAVLTSILFLALLNCYHLFGEISHWALVNKAGGWMILIGLFGIGGWIGTNARERDLRLFVKTFVYFVLLVTAAQCLFMTVQTYVPAITVKLANYPIAGLMANRNAFAFLFIAAIAMAMNRYFSQIPEKDYSAYLISYLVPFFWLFNGSRTSAIMLVLIFAVTFILYRRQWKKAGYLVLCMLAAAATTFVLFHAKKDQLEVLKPDTYQISAINKNAAKILSIDKNTQKPKAEELQQELPYSGDRTRLKILSQALPMVSEHPVIGSGLGSIMMVQQKNLGELVDLVDCTPLWLLIETGLIGLCLFLAFYLLVVKSLLLALRDDDISVRTMRLSVLFVILGFTVMCLFHEIMYTRHLWFLLGLGLALPSRMRQAE